MTTKNKKTKGTKKSLNALIEKTAKRLQLLVRLKASDKNGICECVSCGVKQHYKKMQGGHFIPRSKKATTLLEENIHPQCRGCNGFKMKYGTAAHAYTLYMQDMYGRDYVEYLLSIADDPSTWTHESLENLLQDINAQIKTQQQRIEVHDEV